MVEYTQATIFFPEYFQRSGESPLIEHAGNITGSSFSFTRNGFLIEATISPYYIPAGLSENEIVQREIVEPARKILTEDIGSIDDLLEELREFTKNKRFSDSFYFRKQTNPNRFKVFDYSREKNEKNERPFETLLKYKGLDIKMLNETYQNLARLAVGVEKNPKRESEFPYVTGKTLRIATERAVNIYRAVEQLV